MVIAGLVTGPRSCRGIWQVRTISYLDGHPWSLIGILIQTCGSSQRSFFKLPCALQSYRKRRICDFETDGRGLSQTHLAPSSIVALHLSLTIFSTDIPYCFNNIDLEPWNNLSWLMSIHGRLMPVSIIFSQPLGRACYSIYPVCVRDVENKARTRWNQRAYFPFIVSMFAIISFYIIVRTSQFYMGSKRHIVVEHL